MSERAVVNERQHEGRSDWGVIMVQQDVTWQRKSKLEASAASMPR